MKKINKLLVCILTLFILLNFNTMKVDALDYSKTYEEAFPDKEFRRLILICVNYNLCDYSTNTYLIVNWHFQNLIKYNASKKCVNDNETVNVNIDENLIESKKTEVLNKAQLDRITYLMNSTGGNPQNMKSLKGIEYLTNLKQLAFEKIGTKEVDLSQNKNLVHVSLTSEFLNYYHSYQESPGGELDTATLEKVNIKGLKNLEGLMLTLNKNKENTIDLSDLHNLKEVIINDSNLTDIKFYDNAVLENVSLQLNSLSNILIPPKTNLNNVALNNQKFKMTIKVNADKEFPIKLNLPFVTKVENMGNTYKYYINPSTNDVTNDGNYNYTFNSLNLGKNVFNIEKEDPTTNIKYNATLEINIEKDNTILDLGSNNIIKNPKTGIKTFSLILALISIISFLIFKYLKKKKTCL